MSPRRDRGPNLGELADAALYALRLAGIAHNPGQGLERVTFNETFDGFPMFSPDGTKLAFCSNRGNRKRGETNVFVADWVP